MNNKKLLVLLAIVGIIIMVSLAIYQMKGPEENSTIKVGAIFPLTGNLAFLGIPERDALLLAVNEINDQGGNLICIIEDSKGQAKDAIAAAQKLVNIDKVNLGIVSTSTMANAVAPIYQDKGIPLITVCSDDSIPKKYNLAVNIYVNLEVEQKVMAEYLIKENISKLSVIRVNAQITERGIKLLRDSSKGNLSIISDLTYELGTTDFKNLILKAGADRSEAIYIMGYGPEFPSLVKELKQMQIKKRVFGNYMFLSDPARSEGTALYKDIRFTSFNLSPQDLMSTKFGKLFISKKKGDLSPFLDYLFIYEAIHIWYKTISSGQQPQKFSELVRNKAFKTLFGEVYINSDGNAVVPMAIARYDEKGNVEIIWGK